jgi:hypothetical protein
MKFLAFIFFVSGMATAGVDHSASWTGVRKQQGLGACHAFATTALVEALYSEVHGQNIDLSEADVFAKSYFGKNQSASLQGLEWIISGAIGLGLDYLNENQGGYVDDDFALIQRSGIKAEDENPYKGLTALLDAVHDSVKDYRKDLNRTSHLRDHRPAVLEMTKALRPKIEEMYASTPTSFEVAQLLSKYRVHRIDLPRGSEEKIQVLKSYLSCRPVAISIQSQALKSMTSGMHAVVLRGYKKKKFLIRNSWSGKGKSSGKMKKLAPFIERAFVLTEANRTTPKRDCP